MSGLSLIDDESLILDDRIRGVPPGSPPFPASHVAEKRWRPADGVMALPVLTLDETAFLNNRDLMLRYVGEQGVAIAPHLKTPMSPELARSLTDAGAWGATVADIRQAVVMASGGVKRLLLANEVGGLFGARRLAAFVASRPDTKIYVFADSVAAVAALEAAWRERPDIPPLSVLAEVGAGRAGARTLPEAVAVARAVRAAEGRLVLAGVATYEGTAVQATPEETLAAIAALLALATELLSEVRALAGPNAPLVVTAGGSLYFDRVIAALKPAIAHDGAAALVIRSGAIFFYDHGGYDRGLAALDQRGGFALGGATVAARAAFRPALRVWAETLSRPEPRLAICGMGMRDVAFDQGFPVPLAVYRGGRPLPRRPLARVVKLNDQHAFLALEADDDFEVGDVVEFGISHPCTCLDRYRFLFGVDEHGYVRHAFPTFFG